MKTVVLIEHYASRSDRADTLRSLGFIVVAFDASGCYGMSGLAVVIDHVPDGERIVWLRLPSEYAAQAIDVLDECLCPGDVVVDDSYATAEAIAERIASFAGTTVAYLHVSMDDFGERISELAQGELSLSGPLLSCIRS